MVAKKNPFIIIIFMVLGFCHTMVNALETNGIATLKQLGSEVFYGTLLVQIPSTDDEEILASSQTMALEIKVISTISKRGWSSLWTQGVAINNSIDFFSAHADDFSKMLAAFKGPLAANDIVRIERVASNETGNETAKITRVVVNNIVIADNLSPGVFLLCLRSWIGSVPYSSTFKEQVLGQSSFASALSTYNKITPLPGRKSIISSWLDSGLPKVVESERSSENEEPVTDQDDQRDPAPLETESLASVGMPPVAVAKPTLLDPETGSTPLGSTDALEGMDKSLMDEESTSESSDDSSENSSFNIENSDSLARENPINASAETAKEDTTITEKSPTLVAAEVSEAEVKDFEKQANQEFTTQSLIAQQRYIQSVRRQIYSVTDYPLSAARRNLEGSVGLSIIVGRNGDLIRAEITDEAEFEPFNKSILRAVQSAAPFEPFPEVMEQDEFTITTPFAFVLQQ